MAKMLLRQILLGYFHFMVFQLHIPEKIKHAIQMLELQGDGKINIGADLSLTSCLNVGDAGSFLSTDHAL